MIVGASEPTIIGIDLPILCKYEKDLDKGSVN